MLSIRSRKIAERSVSMFVLLGFWTQAAVAGDHGSYYHSKVKQHGTLVSTPAITSVGAVGYSTTPQLFTTTYPVTTAYPLAGVPMLTSAVQQPLATTSYYVMVPAPVYQTYVATPVSSGLNSSASLLPSSSNTAGPMLKSASATQSAAGSATVDYVPEYSLFLQQENLRYPGTPFAAAGLRPNPADIAAFNQNYPQLVAAVGANQLGAIGRFLLTKLKDPNFRNNAIKLFEAVLGTFLPQYASLIDLFLNDLIQGSGSGTGTSGQVPGVGGAYNATGVVNGQIVLTPVNGPVTPPAPSPIPPPAPAPTPTPTPAPTPTPISTLPKSLKNDGGTIAPSP
jgi:hypothetical protein